MLLSPVIAHLRARCPSFAQRVAGAAEYPTAKAASALQVPCAFVIPLDDSPDRNASQNGLQQELLEAVAVVVAVPNTADELGLAAADAVHAIRAELWAALLNWQPSPGHDGMEYQTGVLLSVDRARLWWQFEFCARREISEADGFSEDLPHFEGATISVDVIDPIADPNLSFPGPDGRIEWTVVIDNLPV